jgi:cyclohexadieny/prephenate dehydrogenase
MTETAGDAVVDADLVILSVPVGAIASVATGLVGYLKKAAIVTDVGSSKTGISADLERILSGVRVVPAHPLSLVRRRVALTPASPAC